MLNYDGKVGAVGRVPRYMRGIFTTRIVRFDIEHEMPVRGADGLCIECAAGEVGEAIGKIANEPGQTFDGYTARPDTEKKILRDVFEKGDAWFRTGDLMQRDEHGYFYFVDRIGDTFRWKGENVATSEVAEALGVVPGIQEANVYGVAVPGEEGRAGMAALVVEPDFDPAALCRQARRQPAGLCAARFPEAAARDRDHRHLQDAQGRAGQRRFQPADDPAPALHPRPGHTAIPPTGQGAL